MRDRSGALKIRNAPNGLVVGTLKNGTLVIIEETRGDWVSVTTLHEEVGDTGVGSVLRAGL